MSAWSLAGGWGPSPRGPAPPPPGWGSGTSCLLPSGSPPRPCLIGCPAGQLVLSLPRRWSYTPPHRPQTRAAAGHPELRGSWARERGRCGSAIVQRDLPGPTESGAWLGRRQGCSLGFSAWATWSRPMAFWPLAGELRALSASSGPSSGVPGDLWFWAGEGPEQPHFLTRYWSPSTPSYLPGQTPSLIAAVLT